jgi:hypothetical protein
MPALGPGFPTEQARGLKAEGRRDDAKGKFDEPLKQDTGDDTTT